ncbi:cholesterol oxidase substrate-binding domain-containing protein [Streptomyces massasporeus]
MWNVSPTRPLTSRKVSRPYNYPFSDNIPGPVAELVGRMTSDAAWYLAPLLGTGQYEAAALGLVSTLSADLWGPGPPCVPAS